MRITGTGPQDLQGTASASESTAAAHGAPAAQSGAAAPMLQSAILEPALAALRDMPDIDLMAVKTLSDALANGEVPFNAGRLAGLIERYHGKNK